MPVEVLQPPAGIGWIGRLETRIGHAEEWVAMALIAAMAVLVNMQIFARYLFDHPIIWSEEVTRLSLGWLTFIAVPALIRRGGDMVVDTFVNMLPAVPRLWAHAVRDVLMVVVYGLVTWQGYRLTRAIAGMPLVVTEWPSSLMAWPLVIGGTLVIFHVGLRLFATLTAIRHGAGAQGQAT